MTTHSTELEAELDKILDIAFNAGYVVATRHSEGKPSGTISSDKLWEAKQSLSTLIAQREQAAELRGVSTGMYRAKAAVTAAMNTGSTTLTELRAVIDKEIKWWDENMVATKPEKGAE